MSFFERINSMTPQQALLAYLAKGKSVFPVGPDKRPRLPWKVYQTTCATPFEADQWLRRWPGEDLALGFPTGAQNGFNVLDADSEAAEGWLAAHAPATALMSRTKRGLHRFYRVGALKVPTVKNLGPGAIDARGEGGYVVIAPSVIAGHRYAWEIGSGAVPTLDVMGEAFFQQQKATRRHGRSPAADRAAGSSEQNIDPDTGLIDDGREGFMCKVIMGLVASHVRDHGTLPDPEYIADRAWEIFCDRADLSDGKYSYAACLEKAIYAVGRVGDGTLVITDDDAAIGDAAAYEEMV